MVAPRGRSPQENLHVSSPNEAVSIVAEGQPEYMGLQRHLDGYQQLRVPGIENSGYMIPQREYLEVTDSPGPGPSSLLFGNQRVPRRVGTVEPEYEYSYIRPHNL